MSLPVESGLFWALAIIGVLLTGISKSGFAGGAGVVAVPLLAFVVSVPQATALMLPLLLVMDAHTVHYYRKHIDSEAIKSLLPAALLGIVVGGLSLGVFPDQTLQLLLGIFSVVFAVWSRLLPFFSRLKGAGFIWGGIAGFTSTLIHSGGPPLQIYLLSRRLPKLTWLATAGVMFAAMNVVKIIPYGFTADWSRQMLLIALLLIPAALLGVKLGHMMQGRLSEALFTDICRYCLLGTGILLVIKAF